MRKAANSSVAPRGSRTRFCHYPVVFFDNLINKMYSPPGMAVGMPVSVCALIAVIDAPCNGLPLPLILANCYLLIANGSYRSATKMPSATC